MLKCVEGIYRDGKVELAETPEGVKEARVIVTFLGTASLWNQTPPLTPGEIAELRWKLAAWEEDWNAPGMEVYDELPTR
ncbi:MAG: hypothetical protein FJ279_27335 [Planctomycetes bacterium]|nr:hypothetical protein [Planctomycetota bacterium]MBM4085645.1 hypothetical protein [Planctomycetota bacterium]